MYAAAGGHARVAQLLLELGAPVSNAAIVGASTLEVRRLLEASESAAKREAARLQRGVHEHAGARGCVGGVRAHAPTAAAGALPVTVAA